MSLRALALGLLLPAPLLAQGRQSPTQSIDTTRYERTAAELRGLRWRLVGPFRGGRSVAVSGDPSNPRVFYFGAVDGFVYCLDAGTGDLMWKFQANGPIVSSAAVQEGVIYIGSMDHQVYALRA